MQQTAWSPREHDDDPPPRRLVPSGSMQDVRDGAHRLPDLRGRAHRPRPPAPADLKTAGQKRRWARDIAILTGRQNGMTIAALANAFNLSTFGVRDILRRYREKAGVG